MEGSFQNLGATTGGEAMKATPVHHEAIKGSLEAQIGDHDEAIKGYSNRIDSGDTLAPDEYQDYESRMKEKSHDSLLLEKLNKQHNMLQRRSKRDKAKSGESDVRDEATELYNQFGGNR
jgi:hypothetical protein